MSLLRSSAMDWFVLCTVHDTRNIVLQHLFSNAFCCFLFKVHVSHQLEICMFVLFVTSFCHLLLSIVSPCLAMLMRVVLSSSRSGVAIQLDEDLFQGWTERSDTFGNPPLLEEADFKCAVVEVYAFH